MDRESLKRLLERVSRGELKPDEALDSLKHLPFEDIGFAHIDHHRELRQGVPEVIYCEGKTPEQVVEIMERMLSKGADILATRVHSDIYQKVKLLDNRAYYNELARTIVINNRPKVRTKGKVLIITGGTSDISVAEEAWVTADILGSTVGKLYDVGVAGIHRLFDNRERLFSARVIVVIAGMDGALASVIGGLVDKPVIAVPTSVGYGASFGGISALLTMLNSCAPGVATVNIDNGFGAGYLAHIINELGEKV
jgi:NCAIR mutase (PurE)-related protein